MLAALATQVNQLRIDNVQLRIDNVKSQEVLVEIKNELKGSASTAATLATKGSRVKATLDTLKTRSQISGSGPAVVEGGLPITAFTLKEDQLVELLTPYLRSAVSSDARLSSVCVVNTERHAYVRCPDHGTSSSPDLLFCDRAAFAPNKTPGDVQLHGDGSLLFGALAAWELRDLAVAVCEFKSGTLTERNEPWGEVQDYVTRWVSHVRDRPGVAVKLPAVMRWVLADAGGFHMLLFSHRGVASCVDCTWGAAGGLAALRDFLAAGVTEAAGVLAAAAQAAEVEVPVASPKALFLGSGSTGRVFRAMTANGAAVALKVAVGSGAADAIEAEVAHYGALHAAEVAHYGALHDEELDVPMFSVLGPYVDPAREWAALVVTGVGESHVPSRSRLVLALKGLKVFGDAGWRHGDARWANVVWQNGGAVWIDLHRCMKGADLVSDVLALLASVAKDQFDQAPVAGLVKDWDVTALAAIVQL